MARVEISPDWESHVLPAWVGFAESRLGPDIADDARRYCPVDTGALKASIEDHMEDTDLIVSASGGGEDEGGNLFVSSRAGKVSGEGFHKGAEQAKHVGTAVTREVHHVEEGGRTYALFVEMGHKIYHPSTGVTGPEVKPAQAFLRPALFQRRGD